jgi:hypothetical protein
MPTVGLSGTFDSFPAHSRVRERLRSVLQSGQSVLAGSYPDCVFDFADEDLAVANSTVTKAASGPDDGRDHCVSHLVIDDCPNDGLGERGFNDSLPAAAYEDLDATLPTLPGHIVVIESLASGGDKRVGHLIDALRPDNGLNTDHG